MKKRQNRSPKNKARRHYVIAIIVISLLITYFHYSTVSVFHAQHDIYREFYSVSVFMGALAFEGHRGSIHVHSQPGDGTEVRIELPCKMW